MHKVYENTLHISVFKSCQLKRVLFIIANILNLYFFLSSLLILYPRQYVTNQWSSWLINLYPLVNLLQFYLLILMVLTISKSNKPSP